LPEHSASDQLLINEWVWLESQMYRIELHSNRGQFLKAIQGTYTV